MYSTESKSRVATVIAKIKEQLRKIYYSDEGMHKTHAVDMATSLQTIRFFMADNMPFDAVTVNRIDGEIEILNKIIANYL